MKKFILLGIAATALLTACSNDDVVEVKSPTNTIGFSTFVEKSTRAATDATKDNLHDFAVYGYTKTSTDADYHAIFVNEAVTAKSWSDDDDSYSSGDATSDVWSYTNIQYWTVGNAYQFHAISPSEKGNWSWENVNSETGKIEFDNSSANGEKDLIYAYDGSVTSATSSQDKVKFTFNHLLSKVAFKFTNAFTNTNVEITISDLKITNAYKSGTITLGSSTANGKSDGTSAWTTSGNDLSLDFAFDSNTLTTSGITSAHKYLIPATASTVYKANYKLTIKTYVSDKTSSDTHEFTIENAELPSVAMLPGNSYLFTASIDKDNIDPTDPNTILKPIEFGVTAVNDFGSFEEKAIQYNKSN